jgi:cyclohexanone monooxygenase
LFNNASTVAGMTSSGTSTGTSALPGHVRTLVVGAGFAGLCAAIKLDEDGERDWLVVDKGPELGGTWRDNTYPGAACDVPSHLYSFSFAPNPEWSSTYSPQPEIQDYLRRVARDAGVLDRFVFETVVESMTWDDATQTWTTVTSRGTVTSQLLVLGAGGLSEPRLPDIEGIDTFEGSLFHSAQWDHDTDLTGQRVAVIGTGASAVQIVPEVQQVAAHLDVYQRTASWVIPRGDRRYTGWEKALYRRAPWVQQASRQAKYWSKEALVPGFTRWQQLNWPVKQMARANLARGVPDPVLRERLTPDFDVFCKRILISNTYYPAVAADNVELVTDPIARITPTGIVTADGTERPVDVLVVATGFHTTDLPIADHVHGRGGVTLGDTWREHGMAAYKGSTVRGFPNLFFIVGPNVALGHSSMVFIIESQVAYLRDAVRTLTEHGWGAVEPTAQAQQAWNDDVQRRMGTTVWNRGGCSSWYLDSHGRNTTLWPRQTFTFRRLLRRFDPEAYEVADPVRSPAPTRPERISA